MNPLPPILAEILHLALLLAALPVLTGFLGWADARLAGRQGPGFIAPWRALRRLLRKQPVLAEEASPLFCHVPLARCAVLLAAAILVPSFARFMVLAPVADVLAIGGLLALARVSEILAAIDSGSGPGGAAAAHAIGRMALLEPAMLLVLFALAAMTGSTNLDAVSAALREVPAGMGPVLILLGLAMAVMTLADHGRRPFAAPDAWQRDYSGRDLALIEIGDALRLLVWLNLIASLILPWGLVTAQAILDWPVGVLAWAAKIGTLAMGLALLAAGRAMLRPDRTRELLAGALLLGLLALVVLFAMTGGA